MGAAPSVLGRGHGVAGLSLALPKTYSVPIVSTLISVTNFDASFVLLFKLTLFLRTPIPWLLLNHADGHLPL